MTDLPTDDGDATGSPAEKAHEPHRRPRWVTVTAAVVSAVIVLFVILKIAGVGVGAGDHGPGRHLGGGGAATTIAEHTGPPGGDHGRQP